MMRFAVESWSPEYGVAADPTDLEDARGEVDVAVERRPDDWAPVSVSPGAAMSVVFVDGVRRIDARVWIVDGETVRPGVCASVAAGAVHCEGSTATVIEPRVSRGLFAAGSSGAGPIVTRHGTYGLVPCAGDDAEALYLGIHEEMTSLEKGLSIVGTADCVVYDGPLRGRNDPSGVGFVKTQAVQYLPDELQPVLARLGAGDRTPLFLIGGGGGFTRWSWYLRLPGPVSQPLSAIVRCELAGAGTAADAIERADAVSGVLPRFASEPHKDARAPQNLYPIAGLEHELRRRLGDQYLLERALRVAAAEVSA
jgi:hypothetical protein